LTLLLLLNNDLRGYGMRKNKSLRDGVYMTLSLSFREMAIITSSLEKWPEKAIDCLIRLKELSGSLRTRNPFEIGGSKVSSLKDSSLSISISHKTTTYLKVRILLIIMFSSK